jgi:hypothetical protein
LELFRAERATLPGRVLGVPMGVTVGLCFVDSTIGASADSPRRLADVIVNLLHRREPCPYSRVIRSFICRRATWSQRTKRSTFAASSSAARPFAHGNHEGFDVVWGVALRLLWLEHLEDAGVLMAELPLWRPIFGHGGAAAWAAHHLPKSSTAARSGAPSPTAARRPNGKAHAIQTFGRAALRRASP